MQKSRCLPWAITLRNAVLIQNLSENWESGKIKSSWEDEIGVILESKGNEDLVYTVRPETYINGKVRILHRNSLVPYESTIEEPEGVHLFQKNSDFLTSN